MKKFLLVALALTLVLGLCACGGNNAEDSTTTTTDGGEATTTTTTTATTTTTTGFTYEDDTVFNDVELDWG